MHAIGTSFVLNGFYRNIIGSGRSRLNEVSNVFKHSTASESVCTIRPVTACALFTRPAPFDGGYPARRDFRIPTRSPAGTREAPSVRAGRPRASRTTSSVSRARAPENVCLIRPRASLVPSPVRRRRVCAVFSRCSSPAAAQINDLRAPNVRRF